jgi:hypothetical protein
MKNLKFNFEDNENEKFSLSGVGRFLTNHLNNREETCTPDDYRNDLIDFALDCNSVMGILACAKLLFQNDEFDQREIEAIINYKINGSRRC